MTLMQDDGQPITTKTIVTWSGVIALIGGGLISLVWWAGGLNTRVTTVENAEMVTREKIKAVDDASLLRHNAQQKDIDKLSGRQDQTDRSVAELQAKLDVAITILQRIDQKMNRP